MITIDSKPPAKKAKPTPRQLLAENLLLNLTEAARVLNCSTRTVANMIERGQLDACIVCEKRKVTVDSIRDVIDSATEMNPLNTKATRSTPK